MLDVTVLENKVDTDFNTRNTAESTGKAENDMAQAEEAREAFETVCEGPEDVTEKVEEDTVEDAAEDTAEASGAGDGQEERSHGVIQGQKIRNINVFKTGPAPEGTHAGSPDLMEDLAARATGLQAAPRRRPSGSPIHINPVEASSPAAGGVDKQWHDMTDARNRGRILSGTLSGLTPAGPDGVMAIVTHNGLNVTIPVRDMGVWPDKDPRYSQANAETALSKICSQMIGAEVDFIILSMDRAKNEIIGSRARAVRRRIQTMFFAEDGDTPRIQKGSVVEARVLAAGKETVRVDVFGVSVRLTRSDLSHAYIADCRDKVNVGDRLYVLVNSISGNTPETIRLDASARDAEADRTADELDRIVKDGNYLGTVCNYANGAYFVRLEVGCNVICHYAKTTSLPRERDRVSVLVNFIDRKEGKARGIITSLLSGVN